MQKLFDDTVIICKSIVMRNLTTLADRIIAARERLGIKQFELAELIHIKQQSLSTIEQGETKKPRNLKKIAEILKVNPEWLEYGINPPSWANEPEDEKPFFEIIPGLKVPTLAEYLKNSRAFTFDVNSNAMSDPHDPKRSMQLGQTAIIYPGMEPENGENVFAIQKGNATPIFRQYQVEGKIASLEALNPDRNRFPSIPISDVEMIIGVVIYFGYGLIKKKFESIA